MVEYLHSNLTFWPLKVAGPQYHLELFNKYNNKEIILVTVTQSVTNVPQTKNTSTSGMNEE